MQSVRAGSVLVARELRRLLRDPAAVLAILLAPFLLAVITSVSLGARPKIPTALGVAGIPAAALPPTQAHGGVRVIAPEQAVSLVRNGTIAAAIVVPRDPAEPVHVIAARDARIANEVATSIAHTIAAGRANRLDAAPVLTTSSGRKPLNGGEIYGPIIAVFFVLFGVGAVSRSLQVERLDGTLSRLLVSPIRPSVILASKGVLMFLVGMTEMTIVLVTTTLLYGADWGNLGAVVLVMVLVVLSGIAIAAAIAGVTNSPAQAQGLEFATALALVAIGGHMVPLRNLPDAAQQISRFTPNGAALDAFGNIASHTGSLASQLAPLIIVVSFTLVVSAIALARMRKVLTA
jgi:ABC-2 type transport system permease protein